MGREAGAGWSRRALLLGAVATAASVATAGCGLRRGPVAGTVIDGPWLLGWRFVAGSTLAYRCRIARRQGELERVRVEEWTYAIRDVDADDVATLDARQTGHSGRAHDPAVTLRLHGDGRLLSCDAVGFERDLVHRGLALPLPTAPIRRGDAWADPFVVRPFLDLFPPGTAAVAHSEARLLEVVRRGERTLATVQTEAALALGAREAIALTGLARWDARRGVLASRELEARVAGGGSDPDLLQLSWERVG